MKKVIKTNMHVYTITENGGKVSMVSDNPNENFNFEGVETSIDSVMQRFEVAMKLRGEVICEVITDGWVDGEWAWEDDGTKPKAPADPEMKAWLESLGCVFEVDEDDAESFWSERMEEVDGEVDGIVRRTFFEENELHSWDKTNELSSVIATVMDVDRKCHTDKIFWDTPIFVVGDLEVRYTSPCREFETGCILVNEKDGGMVGNWSELTEGWDDCGLNPDELSAQMWSIIGKYYQKELDRVVNDTVADYDSYGPGTFNVGNIQVPYMALTRELEDVFKSFAVDYDEKTGFATAVTIFETETRPHF